MRNRYNADSAKSNSPTNSYENVISDLTDASEADKSHQVFMGRPFCQYQGHTSDLLDVSWSKNYFILTSSMDKTVRLWHISR
jgi:WD40 repeat protein